MLKGIINYYTNYESTLKCNLWINCIFSIYCHMILHKAFYADIFIIENLLKTVVLVNVSCQNHNTICFQDFLMNRKFKKGICFQIDIIFYVIINFTFDQFITSLLNKSINFFKTKHLTDPIPHVLLYLKINI